MSLWAGNFVEKQYRREDFAGGVPITLLDGNEWCFAEPMVMFVPADNDTGFEVCLELDGSMEFRDLIDEYDRLRDLTPEEFQEYTDRWIRAEIRMARLSLERNYNIPIHLLNKILRFPGDPSKHPEADRIRKEILAVVTGFSPKP